MSQNIYFINSIPNVLQIIHVIDAMIKYNLFTEKIPRMNRRKLEKQILLVEMLFL